MLNLHIHRFLLVVGDSFLWMAWPGQERISSWHRGRETVTIHYCSCRVPAIPHASTRHALGRKNTSTAPSKTMAGCCGNRLSTTRRRGLYEACGRDGRTCRTSRLKDIAFGPPTNTSSENVPGRSCACCIEVRLYPCCGAERNDGTAVRRRVLPRRCRLRRCKTPLVRADLSGLSASDCSACRHCTLQSLK